MGDTHLIIRTSPKGKGWLFIGICSKCGKIGLTTADINEPCENFSGLTQDESILSAIEGKR